MRVTLLLLVAFLVGCGSGSKYEVIERTEKEVTNFQAPGTHTEVNYVLLHDNHKIYATCDWTNISNLDPNASCGFRPLHSYECEIQSDSTKSKLPMSDLKCKDADGRSVYLYVSKKE